MCPDATPTATPDDPVYTPAATPAGYYCGATDLVRVKTVTELTLLADLDGDLMPDDSVLDGVCSDATDLINSYVSPRYTLPLATVPSVLKSLAVRVALYYLYLGRASVADDVRKQQEADVKWLEKVRAGDISLGDPIAAPGGDKAPGIQVNSNRRDFTRRKMEGF